MSAGASASGIYRLAWVLVGVGVSVGVDGRCGHGCGFELGLLRLCGCVGFIVVRGGVSCSGVRRSWVEVGFGWGGVGWGVALLAARACMHPTLCWSRLE